MKIFTVIGARPQFIKAAVVSRVLKEHFCDIHEVLVHTGQHYDANMSEVFFKELNIPQPHHNLGIGGGTHGENTGRMVEKLEALMILEKPDWVMVYGDTDSTLAGALSASKLHIPIAHVEAGLRSFNRRMPEEINRVLTDHIATILFAPTELARTNLLNEGIDSNKIHVVGDVMFDATLFYKNASRKPAWFDSKDILDNKFVLCTIHRAENTDDLSRMQNILQGLEVSRFPVLLPLHPRTRNNIIKMRLNLPQNIYVVDPVGYLEMIWLESNCQLIVTDSGGVQKEAFFHQKFCITLRDETEWVELVTLGVNKLVGADKERIISALQSADWNFENSGEEIYGNGTAGFQVINALLNNIKND